MPSRGTVPIYIEDADGAFGWGEIWSSFPTITTGYRAQLAAWVLPSRLIGSEIYEPKLFTNELKNNFTFYLYNLEKLVLSMLLLRQPIKHCGTLAHARKIYPCENF